MFTVQLLSAWKTKNPGKINQPGASRLTVTNPETHSIHITYSDDLLLLIRPVLQGMQYAEYTQIL